MINVTRVGLKPIWLISSSRAPCQRAASTIYNFLKNKHTTHICGIRKPTAVKISHTRAKDVHWNDPNACNCLYHDSLVCYFYRLQRIEGNEAVARQDLRFKLLLCCHYWNTWVVGNWGLRGPALFFVCLFYQLLNDAQNFIGIPHPKALVFPRVPLSSQK